VIKTKPKSHISLADELNPPGVWISFLQEGGVMPLFEAADPNLAATPGLRLSPLLSKQFSLQNLI